ncbi:hypothetical protein OEZ85_013807 [Tetradesmus obliquus]|uniref:Citrate transporter-like domain-containing protein n=1 Tax=Tetradesmus obliquus TaxID=3088 RepID=A0ABY8U8Z0_TETOB|nr:hypothetical protein OEZ85_013807 [Tetradesmus obliquus]
MSEKPESKQLTRSVPIHAGYEGELGAQQQHKTRDVEGGAQDVAAVSDMFADDSLALTHTASFSAASAHSKLWRMASVQHMAAAQLPLASEWAAGAQPLESATRRVERSFQLPNLFERQYWHNRTLKWWLLMRWCPGARLPELLFCVLVALLLTFAVPRPAAIRPDGWGVLGVFVATIVGLIVRPLPMGGVCMLSSTIMMWSGLLTSEQALSAFTDKTVWLIVGALLMAQAVDKSGLGLRVSLLFIAAVGQTALGLTYALMGADLLIAMAMPSTTAREGGVFMPIIRSISASFGSYPDDAKSKLLGAFLMMAQLQHTQPTSAMWLTGAAPNAMAIGLAHQQGVVLPGGDWVTWVKGACVPSLLIMAVTPLAVFGMYKPNICKTPEAPKQARMKLKELGRVTYVETTTLTVLLIALGFWIGGSYVKPTPITTMAVAFMALSLLLLTGALNWDDCLACTFAWDTLFWIAILMSQSKALTEKGVIAYFAEGVSSSLIATGMPPVGMWMLLLIVYVAMHYLFASQSAHVAAMYPAFLAVMLRCGISPVLSAMSLAYIGNTMTAMTHYASAESVVYFSQRYYTVKAVWGVGAVMTLLNLAVWLAVGLGWFKAVGFYSDISTMA